MSETTKTTKLFGEEAISLDPFQIELLSMAEEASSEQLSLFFRKNYKPFFQFLLKLYITSLQYDHPDRGRQSPQNDNKRTNNETKIISQWSNILTQSPNNSPTLTSVNQQHNQSLTTTLLDYSDTNLVNNNNNNAVPDINEKKSIINERGKKKKEKKGKKGKHHGKGSVTGQSFSAIGTLAKHLAKNTATSYYMANTGKVQVTPSIKPGGGKVGGGGGGKVVKFDPDVDEKESDHQSMKDNYVRNRGLSRRDSIWDGVLDVENIIMTPENTRIWRSRNSIQQNALIEESLLDSITTLLTPNAFKKSKNKNISDNLWDEILSTSTDAMILYLPFLCVITTKLKQNEKIQTKLKESIIARCTKEEDIKQAFSYFVNSYKSSNEIIKVFANDIKKLATSNSSTNNNNKKDDWQIKNRPVSDSIASTSTQSSSSSLNNKDKLIIQQTNPESGIQLFSNILNKKLIGNTEIVCHVDNNVRDPINYDAPPLSRIDIRKVIQSATKPLLIDCYVANKKNNFEYLSSTMILKKGDDLRTDASILHIFRLMNKIWREKDINFNSIPIYVYTYKCIPMASDFGAIELVSGCKPLRMINSLFDSITIGQQFNLVASAVGCYIAAFVLGIRDRHFDNVLIRHNDCTIFHIDFGFVLGNTPTVDTSKFSITKDLKELMGPYWDTFIELSCVAYLSLRERYKELCKFARLAFDQIEKSNKVEQFIIDQLHINDKNDAQASRYIAQKLKESPDSVKTKFKNVMHGIATIGKKNN